MSAFARQIAGPAAALLLSAYCDLVGGVACADSSSPDVVRRYEFGSIGVSLRYGYDVLDAALERSVVRYGSYKVEPVLTELSVSRLHKEGGKGDMIKVLVGA